MDRRQFIKFGGFITVSAATGGLAGCGGSGSAPTTPGIPAVTGKDWTFPQSVASGDPRPDSILLWTRVVPAALGAVATVPSANANVGVQLRVTADPHTPGSNAALAGTMVADTVIAAQAQYDNTIRHKLTGLQPGTTYYYQFTAGDVRSNIGRFKTAPAAGAAVNQLRFAYLTCQDWSINHWGALAYIAANEELDFIVHLGDYIYETVGEAFQAGAVEARHDALKLPDGVFKNGASGPKYASTLADYRYLYKKYRTDTRLQAVHERFAFIAIWDDHEFTDDAWQDAQTYEGQNAADGGNVKDAPRRRNANQAWFEFMPADVSFDAANASFQNIRIYRDFQFGNLMSLIMTDQRLYRSDHVIPEAAPNPVDGKPVGAIGARYLVPQEVFNGAEAQKMAAAAKAGADPLTPVSMLGNTQRDWWKDRMKSAATTWKLWGNEVSLLRMGMSGVEAVATLLALNAVGTLAASIGAAAASTGNVPLAAAMVSASTSGASPAVAQAAAQAIAGAGPSQTVQGAAAVAAGLSVQQATIAVGTYGAAQTALAANASTPTLAAQAAAVAGAQIIAFGWIKPDILARKVESPFVAASGKAAALGPYFRRFLINCDQWDGYNSERKALMAHLKSNNIKNVVALTGDIHSFFAGAVHDDYDAPEGGTPVMVDLVSAGVSSDSFFVYLRDAAASLGDLATLVSYPLALPVPNLGTVTIDVNLLDYTLGKAAPTVDSLAEQLRVRLRGALAAKGVPEAQLDSTVAALQAGLKTNAAFTGQLVPLAQQLAALNSNPWLKHVNTDAQGYTVVTLTPGSVAAQFKQVNRLVGAAAPASTIAGITYATVLAGSPSVIVA